MPRSTPSQIAALPAPRSPASALNNAAAAAAMSAGFNAAYATSAGQLNTSCSPHTCNQDPRDRFRSMSQPNACDLSRKSLADSTQFLHYPDYNGIVIDCLLSLPCSFLTDSDSLCFYGANVSVMGLIFVLLQITTELNQAACLRVAATAPTLPRRTAAAAAARTAATERAR